MAERKQISKGLRYEVFKRDKFTCQYCGRMAPDVILEVDHIKPVSKGGTNNILNLITSCRDCNRGKGNKLLSENAEIKLQQEKLLDLADKKEQLQMMVDWKNELLNISQKQIDSIDKLICELTGWTLNASGRRIFMKYLGQFSFDCIWDATLIAFEKYYDEYKSDDATNRSFNKALDKIGGICYNMTKKRKEDNGNLQGNSDVVLDRLKDS